MKPSWFITCDKSYAFMNKWFWHEEYRVHIYKCTFERQKDKGGNTKGL